MMIDDERIKQFFHELELEKDDEVIVESIIRHRLRDDKHRSLQDLERAMLHLRNRINDIKTNY
jgi:hypothetical protein